MTGALPAVADLFGHFGIRRVINAWGTETVHGSDVPAPAACRHATAAGSWKKAKADGCLSI